VTLDLDIQFALEEEAGEALPSATDLRRWANAAFAALPSRFRNAPQMTLRIVSEAEITQLNTHYRHKPMATNVLSFPFQAPPGLPPAAVPPALGDVVICAAVVAREARQQHKTPASHWAHMVVHGTLHLLGYDHMNDAEAQEMEALEAQILARLGYPDPYQAERPSSEAS
jgi:probable rRNA maturation factor